MRQSSAHAGTATIAAPWQSLLVLVGLFIGGAAAGLPAQAPAAGPAPRCAPCSIVLERIVTLGSANDPRSIHQYASVVQDSRGNYFVAPTYNRGEIFVYGSDGRFLRSIGKLGNGPGEFQEIAELRIGPGDSLWVSDYRQGRVTVLDPSGRRARAFPFSGVLNDLLPHADGRVTVQTSIMSRERAGWPLHLVDSQGAVMRSFGTDVPEERLDRPTSSVRRLARGPGETLWVSLLNNYTIEQWDTSGRRLRRLVRDVPWFRPWQDEKFVPMDVERPNPQVSEIRQGADGVLWTLVVVADANWKQGRRRDEIRREGDGPPTARLTLTQENSYRDTMIEAIDPATSTLLASRRLPDYISGFASDSTIYSMRELEDGQFVIDVWRIRIQ